MCSPKRHLSQTLTTASNTKLFILRYHYFISQNDFSTLAGSVNAEIRTNSALRAQASY